jgi:SAM-dependent methyltransferase
MVFLPGTDKQLKFFLENTDLHPGNILVIGSNSERLAVKLQHVFHSKIFLIVEDNDSLLNSRFILAEEKNIHVRMMEFSNTDFIDSGFDLVYAQASISNSNRNKIIKEMKRILKEDGHFCVGEIVRFSKYPPKFVEDIFTNSDLSPLISEELRDYYARQNFRIIYEKDISESLRDFYIEGRNLMNSQNLNEDEKIYYKKILNKISHESNAYLKMGADKHIGFKTLLLQKGKK